MDIDLYTYLYRIDFNFRINDNPDILKISAINDNTDARFEL